LEQALKRGLSYPEQQARLCATSAASMQGVPAFIVDGQFPHFAGAESRYGSAAHDALRMNEETLSA
jgi:hypothetical protein